MPLPLLPSIADQMEQALQIYERATQEATAELRSAWKRESEKLSRKSRALEDDRRVLEAERTAFAAEIAGVEGVVTRPTDRVLLNVGGKHFETTRQTLTAAPDSLLGSMFSGRHEGRLRPDGEGRVFLDRSGPVFECILDFLRGYALGNENPAFAIHALPEAQLAVMREELDYYGLEDAVFPRASFNIDVATFSPGPEMLSARRSIGAVVRPDNRGVLIAGGGESSTELLDLDTDTFTSGPSIGAPRLGCGTAALDDGRVVLVGGMDQIVRSTTEILHPVTNTWSPGRNLSSARFGCAVVTLSDNRILVLGGSNSDYSHALSTTEIIDLEQETSAPGPTMRCPRYYFSAVMLHDGRVLAIGGRSGNECFSSTEILDLTSGSSSPGPDLDEPRDGPAAVLLPEDGGVLVIGGGNDAEGDLATTEVLNVTANTASAGPELGVPRAGCAAAVLPGERILVLGGVSDGINSSTTEILSMPTEEGHRQKRCRLAL